MQRTLAQLSTLVERQLSQYAGAGVQLYARGIIEQNLQQAFDDIFTMDYWPQFRAREVRDLDGVTGLVTVAFTNIKQYDDIQYVLREFSTRPLPELPVGMQTLNLTGTQPEFIEARNDSFLFTAYPLSATGRVEVIGRNRPAALYTQNDVVPFDDWALVHYAAWSYLTSDGSNPGAAIKEQGLFDMRLKALRQNAEKGIVRINPYDGNIPTTWR